jgi:hypothetical protein
VRDESISDPSPETRGQPMRLRHASAQPPTRRTGMEQLREKLSRAELPALTAGTPVHC